MSVFGWSLMCEHAAQGGCEICEDEGCQHRCHFGSIVEPEPDPVLERWIASDPDGDTQN